MTHPRLRRITAATSLLVLALSLAACSDDKGDDDATDPTTSEPTTDAPDETVEPTEDETTTEPPAEAVVPTEEELTAALLAQADVPEGFVVEPDDGDDEDETFEGTCLGDIGKFDEAFGAEPDAEAKVQYVSEGETSQALVGSGLDAYADTEALQSAFTDFISQLQSCTTVETTDEDGVTIALEIAYDDSVSVPDADQQLKIDMAGTIGVEDQSYDIAYTFVVSVTENVVSLIGAYELGVVDTGLRDGIDGWASLQAERLGALIG